MEKGEPSYTVGGSGNQCDHSGKAYGGSSVNTVLPYMIQRSHTWASTQTKLSLKKTHAPVEFPSWLSG